MVDREIRGLACVDGQQITMVEENSGVADQIADDEARFDELMSICWIVPTHRAGTTM